MKKLMLISAIVLLFLSQMVSIGWTAEPVKIGVALGLNGPAAYMSKEYLKGTQLATEEINKAGGILGGRKLELLVRNHNGIPAEGVSIAKRLILEDKVAIILIGVPSSVAIAGQVVSKELKTVQLSIGYAPDITDKGHPYNFRVCQRAEAFAKKLAEYLGSLPNNNKIALVAPNDDYGRGDLEAFKVALKKVGKPTVVYEDYYERNQTDFNTILLKMKSLNPDCYYINVRWPASAIALQQMEDLAMLKNKYLSSSVNFYNREMAKRVGHLMEGAVMTVAWAPVFSDPESQKFMNAYRAKYDDEPSDLGAEAWGDTMVAAMALDKAGTDKNQEKIREAVKQIKWNSPLGPINFDEKGDSGVPGFVLQFKQGTYYLIK